MDHELDIVDRAERPLAVQGRGAAGRLDRLGRWTERRGGRDPRGGRPHRRQARGGQRAGGARTGPTGSPIRRGAALTSRRAGSTLDGRCLARRARGRVWRAQACRIVEDERADRALAAARDADLPPDRPRGQANPDPGRGLGARARRELDTGRGLPRARPGGRTRSTSSGRTGRSSTGTSTSSSRCAGHPIGYDTFDEKLDLIVRPDGSVEWKDEDELEQAAALGLVDAEAVRAEAARVLEEWPFPTGWEDWRPDPDWPIPQLPDGWDRV